MNSGVFWKKETSDGTVLNCGITEGRELALGVSEGLQEKCEETEAGRKGGWAVSAAWLGAISPTV